MTASALGDRFGRRRLFAGGLALFALASAACALAPTAGWLIAARTVQGAGAAFVMPLALALVSAVFPAERRGSAIGALQGLTGLAVATGPVIGGAVAQGISWSWIFWINVPIGLAVVPRRAGAHPREPRPRPLPRPARPGAHHARGRRGRVGPRARQPGRLGQRRGRRIARRRAAAARRVPVVGGAGAGADAAARDVPLARVLGRQRRDLPDVRVAVRRGVLPRAVPAVRPRRRRPRRRAAAAALDGDAVLRRARRRARSSTASASARSSPAGCCCRASAWAGSRSSPTRRWTTSRWSPRS